MAAFSSSSVHDVHSPMGGIPGGIPSFTDRSRTSRPLATRGAQAASSPGTGAPDRASGCQEESEPRGGAGLPREGGDTGRVRADAEDLALGHAGISAIRDVLGPMRLAECSGAARRAGIDRRSFL